MLCLVLIRRARKACLCESSGFVLAFEIALVIRICILSRPIFLIAGFTFTVHSSPKNWFVFEKNAVSGIRTRVTGLETPNTNQAIL